MKREDACVRIKDMTCCSWHSQRNAIVYTKTGMPVPKEVLDRIPDGPAKEMMMYSGNMCDLCAKRFMSGGKREPLVESMLTSMIVLR
ncbi:hypothetical protein H0O00_00185 [Candidatus Micrarchaeota archaeon]|nr:hypothetical protein [Candidatus Micrarchaeota archaeon]